MKLSRVPEPEIEFAPKHYTCRRAVGELILDGRTDKAFWEVAGWTEDFVDIEGDRRPLPAKRTRVKMLWDDHYFYVAAEMIEDQIWATLTERDSVIFQDNDFEIFIDPDGDTHQYYELEINALNTVWDLLLVKPYRDGGPAVNGWDIQGLKTAVHIDGKLNDPGATNKKWSVEVAMPWKSLRECAYDGRPPQVGEYWRVNFSRVQWQAEVRDGQYHKILNPDTSNPYPEDNWVWSPMGIINMHYPELWGYVVFSADDNEDTFIVPEDEYLKWGLRKLYYRERSYFESYGEYTEDLNLLLGNETWETNPRVETTRSLFQISVPSADRNAIWCIREDGRLWKECCS